MKRVGISELKHRKGKRVGKTGISVLKRAFQNFSRHLVLGYVKGVQFSMEGI